MATFEERKKAFENKYAHDAELQFKVEARRNKLLAVWAGNLLGKSDEETQSYIKEVIKADFEEAGAEDVFRKLQKDLENCASEEKIREQIAALETQAKEEIMNDS